MERVLSGIQRGTDAADEIGRRGRHWVSPFGAQLALSLDYNVVLPEGPLTAVHLGGGGFMTLHLADGRQTFIDFREKAPLAATADMYLGADGNVVKGRSTVGHLAVAVPGTVAGLELALGPHIQHEWRVLALQALRLALGAVDEGRAHLRLGEGFHVDPAYEVAPPLFGVGPRCHI